LSAVFSDARPIEMIEKNVMVSIGTVAMNNRLALIVRKVMAPLGEDKMISSRTDNRAQPNRRLVA
jgi:hypothetical protein